MGANAVTTFPTYTTGQVLEAADLNITNCGVPVFASTVERDAAFGGAGEKVLAEGQLCYLESTKVVQYYDGSSWATVGPTTPAGVVQVKSATKVDTFSTTSATYVDITDLSVSITPTSASNKVLVFGKISIGLNITNTVARVQILRDSTAIGNGNAAGSRVVGNSGGAPASANVSMDFAPQWLDSPATTSATTYKFQIASLVSGQNVHVNRTDSDTDSNARTRTSSILTVMEVTP